MEHIALGMKRDKALELTSLSRHQYYYKPKGGKRGRKPSTTTMYNGDLVSNAEVIKAMEHNHSDPDLQYGYQKMCAELKIQGFEIGEKKTYNLMKSKQMLQDRKKPDGKTYVKYRRVCPDEPYKLMEMDIKFVWIESHRTYAYILTVLDTFSRKTLGWRVGMSVTQHTVRDIWNEILIEHLQPNETLKKGIEIQIRNDNDKRFSAKLVQDFFKENYLNQVFTHPYTPQENGHIESFHAILGRSLDRYHFQKIEDLEIHLTLFYEKYNNQRLHSSIAKLPPNIFLYQWEIGNIIRCIDTEKKKVKFKLRIPYHSIQLSGNESQREASCSVGESLNGAMQLDNKVGDVTTKLQPSVQRSPSVASC
jgi:putative transposase